MLSSRGVYVHAVNFCRTYTKAGALKARRYKVKFGRRKSAAASAKPRAGETPAHRTLRLIEQRIDIGLGVEGHQVVDLFAGAYETDR